MQTRAGNGKSRSCTSSSDLNRAKPLLACQGSLKSRDKICPVGFRGDVFPEQHRFQGEQGDVDELGNLLQVLTVGPPAEKAHQAGYVVDEPKTSPFSKGTRPIDGSMGNHEHF